MMQTKSIVALQAVAIREGTDLFWLGVEVVFDWMGMICKFNEDNQLLAKKEDGWGACNERIFYNMLEQAHQIKRVCPYTAAALELAKMNIEKILAELDSYRSLGSPKTVKRWAAAEQNKQLVTLSWMDAHSDEPDVGTKVLIYPVGVESEVETAEYLGGWEYLCHGRIVESENIDCWASRPIPNK